MVHALSEANRVLVPNGIVIDMRPLGAPPEVEAWVGEEWVSICGLDGAPSAIDDEAVRRALAVHRSRSLVLEAEEIFITMIYWDPAEDFLAQLRKGGFRRFVTPTGDDFRKLERMVGNGGSRIRLHDTVSISRYRRKGG